MPSIQERLNRLKHRNDAGGTDVDPYAILAGLAPQLVIDLARMSGATLEDLTITFQLLSWGDRSALAAYGVVSSVGRANGAGRPLQALPLAHEVVSAAADVTASVADPRDVSAWLRAHHLDSDPHLQPAAVHVQDPYEVDESPGEHVIGKVRSVIFEDGGSLLSVDLVPSPEDTVSRVLQRNEPTLLLKTDRRLDIGRASEVIVSLQETEDHELEPVAVAPRFL